MNRDILGAFLFLSKYTEAKVHNAAIVSPNTNLFQGVIFRYFLDC